MMRLLLTYLVVAAGLLFVVSRFLRPIRPLTFCFLVGLPVLFLGEAFATNGVYAPLDIVYRWEPLARYRDQYGIGGMRTPLLVDVVDMQIPWRKAVRDSVKNGRLPLWNRFQLAGEPLHAVQMSQVFYPGTWLGFALPLAQAWTFDMALRVFLAAVAAYLLLRDMRCCDVAACFGGVAWALSDFLIFFLGFPPSPAAAALPLLVMGLRRIALSLRRSGIALTTVALCLIVSAGHPETLVHAIAAGGLFFLVVIFQQPPGHRASIAGQGLLAGLLGIMLMAVSLVPFLEVLPHTAEYASRSTQFAHATKSVPISQSLVGLEAQLVPYAQGVSGRSNIRPRWEAASYPGLLTIAFAAVGVGLARRDRLPLLVIGAFAAAVAIGFRGAADLIGKLPLFNIAINQRLVFVVAFSLAMLAGMGLNEVIRSGRWRVMGATAASLAVLTTAVFLHRRQGMLELQMPPGYMYGRLILQLAPLLALGAASLWGPGRRLMIRGPWLLPLLLVGVRYGEIGRLYSVAPARAFYPPLDVLSPIDRQAPYRFAAFGLTFIPNLAALYELEDVRAYEAMTLARLVDTYPLWCTPQPVWFNRVDDPMKPFLSFLNVRYFLVPPDYGAPPGWHPVKAGPGVVLLENERVLPRAFIPRRVLCEDRGSEQLAAMHAIGDFADAGVAALGCTPARWIANGRAVAEILAYRPDSLDVVVRAAEPTLLATSVVSWPGWQLKVDGRKADPIMYNHAFLGVRLGSGSHVLTFRYLPSGVAIGAAGSTLTLLLLAAVALRARKRRNRTGNRDRLLCQGRCFGCPLRTSGLEWRGGDLSDSQ